MKEITSAEQKELLLEMLKYVDEICRKNNINYFLYGGTLIGGIRHKGFIPWDDDVDVCVPYKEYRKLIEILKQDDRYNVHDPYSLSEEEYYYMFTKITDKRTVLIENNFNRIKDMGVFLDIFPIFHLPNSNEEYDLLYKKIRKLEKQYFRFYGFEKYYYNKSRLKRVIKSIIFFPQYIFRKKYKNNKKKILELFEMNDSIQTNFIGNPTPPSTYKNRFTAEAFKDKIEVEFEGAKVYAPVGYEEYLTKNYGDYMQLPPEDQRNTDHNFKAYWKE